jgi:hypothetical protein
MSSFFLSQREYKKYPEVTRVFKLIFCSVICSLQAKVPSKEQKKKSGFMSYWNNEFKKGSVMLKLHL